MMRNRAALQKMSAARRGRRILAGAAIASMYSMCQIPHAQATVYTWDPLTTKTGSDGGGTWDNTSPLWSVANADTSYVNGGNTAIFGTNSGAAGTVTIPGQIVVGSITFNAASTGNYLINGGSLTAVAGTTLTITSNVNAEIDSNIGSSVTGSTATFNGLVIAGSGVLTLGGVNTFTTPIVTINNGATLAVTSASTGGALGASSGGVRINGGTLRVLGGTGLISSGPQFRDEGGTLDNSSSASTGSITFNYRADLTDSNGVTARTVTLTGASAIPAFFTSTTSAGFSNTVSNGKTVVASLLKSGTGAWYLNGTGTNSYTGSTTIQSGTLGLASTNAEIPANQTVVIGSLTNSAALDLGVPTGTQSYPLTIAGITSLGSVASDFITNNDASLASANHSAILTINPDGGVVPADSTFGGVIKNGLTSKVAVTKAGSHTLTLTGTDTYTGPTNVNGGTLAISGSIGSTAIGLSATTVNSTLSLLSVSALTSTGVITVTSSNSFTPTIVLDYNGNETVNGLVIGGVAQPNGIYGTGNGDANPSGLFTQDNPFTGTLTVAPEPGSAGLIAVAGATLLARRRRNQVMAVIS